MQNTENNFYKIEKSAVITLIGIIILFSFSVGIVLLAPRHIDPSWTEPTSPYQVQMYEIADPNLYISSAPTNNYNIQYVSHLKRNFSLIAFQETSTEKFIAQEELEKYITHQNDPILKLTSRLLLLRPLAQDSPLQEKANALKQELQTKWEKDHPNWRETQEARADITVLELFDPQTDEAFALAPSEGILENWVSQKFEIIEEAKQPYHRDPGVIYVKNPIEYRISPYHFGTEEGWKYDPNGKAIANLEELKSHELGFRSRQELISLGEHIYAIEGCWYCHTDQTRTLVQDVVLNGSAEFPAPPSSANEYIYQKISFPGTRRIGPDLSRTGIKRPSRDWHKGHFWSPKTASKGSIMPAFKHFFDNNPSGTAKAAMGVPNYRFEAIYQYLMTKGTRITPPTQAWWFGKDPVRTIEIIEGQRVKK